MRNSIFNILIIFAMLCLHSSCIDISNNKEPNIDGEIIPIGKREPNVERNITISGLSSTHWTYFSFETGNIVGTGMLDNDKDDAIWAKRTDWDFAICGDMIKTNSGTSGKGLGGVQKISSQNFEDLSNAPLFGYAIDKIQIIR